jgi:mono/diheme cytochrome c family protein
MRATIRAAGLIVLLAAVGLAQNLAYEQDSKWHAPESASARENPLAGHEDALGGGRKLFQRHCVECHGADGTGRKKAANLTLLVVQAQPDGVLHWKITNGNPDRGMPSFSRLPDLQRWQIVLYLRTFKQR